MFVMKRTLNGSRTTLILSLLILLSGNFIFAQQRPSRANLPMNSALFSAGKSGKLPASMGFMQGNQPTVASFFNEFRTFFNMPKENSFRQVQLTTDKLNQNHYRFNQEYKGIEIIGAQYILHEKKGLVRFANGKLLADLNIDINPSLTEAEALQAALDDIAAQSYMWQNPDNETFIKKEQNNPEATFYPHGQLKITCGWQELSSENCRLVYRFDIYAEEPLQRFYVDVDAQNGTIVAKHNRIHHVDTPGSGASLYNGPVSITIDEVGPGSYRLRETDRGGIETYDMQSGTNFAAAIDFTDGDTDFTDGNAQAGVSAHWGAEYTYDYYYETFSRDGFDDMGGTLFSYAHYGSNYNNAGWDGTRMRYGDGDGASFDPLVCIDVTGHEITHGVTEYSANLVYANEPGALNESFSDIFGTAIEFYSEGLSGDWLIGEDIYLQGAALRSMENPNAVGDPDTYFGSNWALLAGQPANGNDYGGVHTNSSVQNYWFYLLSEGGSGTNDNGDTYNVSAIGIDDASAIAYLNLTGYLTSLSTFQEAREGSIEAATDLFGAFSPKLQSVKDAWDAVGVYGFDPLPGSILVYEGELSGQDYSGDYIDNYLTTAGFTIQYTNIFPTSLLDYEAVFLSFGNYGNGTSNTIFSESMATIVYEYLQAGGSVYLEGGDALGYDQAGNTLLWNAFGLSSVSDGVSNSISNLVGQSGSLANGISFSSSNQVNNSFVDIYSAGSGTLAFIEFPNSDAAVQYSGSFGQKTFCFSYAIEDLVDGSSTKDELMAAIIGFFGLNPDDPLPVTLSSFATGQSDHSIILNWRTESEIENLGFILERKNETEGQFQEIATYKTDQNLIGEGNTSTLNEYYFEDDHVQTGKKYYYKLYDVSFSGQKTQIGELSAALEKPNEYTLLPNYPNPFNPQTRISYRIAEEQHVTLKLYDISGREVKTLLNRQQNAGEYTLTMNASGLAGGVYICKLKAGPYESIRKMVLLK